MTTAPHHRKQRLVLVGAGHSHLEVLYQWARRPVAGTELILINPSPQFHYSGALAAWIARQRHTLPAIDLRPLCQAAHARLLIGRVKGLSPAQQQLMLTSGEDLHYDLLSLNIGGTSADAAIPGAGGQTLGTKPMTAFVESWKSVEAQCRAAPEHAWQLAFVGAGAAGVELALCAAQRLRRLAPHGRVHLFSRDSQPLPGFPAHGQALARQALAEAGVAFHAGAEVTRIAAATLFCGTRAYAADHIFLSTPVAAPAWLKASSLALDDAGFIQVLPTLQSASHPQVFASGDCASLTSGQTTKLGVNAVRQGPVLSDNLSRHCQSRPLKTYTPQSRMLALLSTGTGQAIACRGAWCARGRLWWWLKCWLDGRFLRRYQRLHGNQSTSTQSK